MCGVGGQLIVGREPALIEQTRTMVDALAHRGPDGSGVWADDERGIALGHRRLAVIDVSDAGTQPMTSSSGRWTITFNGEIYNHRRLRSELEAKRVRFRGASDTETLVAAFDAWGLRDTLQRIDGMFAFGVWDHRDERLTLVRDRFGEKPLSWCHDDRRLAFASEVRSLTTLPGFDRTISPTAVASMLSTGFIASPTSIYGSVRQLRPGHLVEARVESGRVVVGEREWWSLSDHVEAAVATGRATARSSSSSSSSTPAAAMAAAVAELDGVMATAVAQRMQSDVPLGAFLSGGIDSSLIAVMAQRALGSTPLETFTVSFPDTSVGDGTDETDTARRVAAHIGAHHTVVEFAPAEVLEMVPAIADVWDEPFGDPSMLPSLALARAARRDLTVCLSGDGGDELFAGYNRHALGAAVARRTNAVPAAVRRGLGAALLIPSASTVDRVNSVAGRALPTRLRLANAGDKTRKLATLLRGDQRVPWHAWHSLVEVWPHDDIVGGRVPPPSHPPASLSATEQMMWLDTSVVLPDNMLVKVDRASMAASLEVRAPFLSPDVLDWAWRQPIDIKTSGGTGKLVVRELVDRLIPGGIADRPKMGFDPPLAAWLRGPLHSWADDLLHRPRCVEQGWLDGAALATTWQQHRDGRRDWTYRLWAVLMLESWLARSDR